MLYDSKNDDDMPGVACRSTCGGNYGKKCD